MASIRKRGPGYEVRIRHKGYPTVVKHFRTKAEAEKFELVIESEMSLGSMLIAARPNVLRALMAEPFAIMSLAELGSKHFGTQNFAG